MLILIGYFASITHILTNAVYIIDNGIDVRLIADDNEFCNIGRIEFYDSINWGSFSDCSKQMTHDIANSVCQTLGWDRADSYNYGPYQTNAGSTIPKYISYTNIYCPASEFENKDICDYDIDNHNDLFDCDICVNCQISSEVNTQCSNISKNEIHSKFDIYVMCNNDNSEANPASNLYNCTDYIYQYNTTKQIYDNEEWHLNMFDSCADAYNDNDNEKHSNVWKFFVVVAVLIGAGVCMFFYCKSTKRMPHRKFTDAYMANMDNDNDIRMDNVDNAGAVNQIGSNYTSLSRERKLSASKEKIIDD